jgi:hypothetical protein
MYPICRIGNGGANSRLCCTTASEGWLEFGERRARHVVPRRRRLRMKESEVNVEYIF